MPPLAASSPPLKPRHRVPHSLQREELLAEERRLKEEAERIEAMLAALDEED
jgi:hypothetical protein